MTNVIYKIGKYTLFKSFRFLYSINKPDGLNLRHRSGINADAEMRGKYGGSYRGNGFGKAL